MELAISKETILTNLKAGNWLLDQLSPLLLKEFIKKQKALTSVDKTLKGHAINHYCQTQSPLLELFYTGSDPKFNQLILRKISKEGYIDNFSQIEREQILISLRHLEPIIIGGLQFLKESSFIKINSTEFKSASSPHLIGAIILTDQIRYDQSYEVAKSIIHELAHNELFLINFFDRLTLETTDGKYHFSPYQNRERPPIGRLHSLWALFRMIQFGQLTQNVFQNELMLFKQTIETLENNVMTEFGYKLISTARECIEKN